MRRWYNDMSMAPMYQPKEPDLSWSKILGAWMVLEMDFQDLWTVDLEACLDTRTWRWFRVRLIALLGKPNSKLKALLVQEVPADG